MEKVIFWITIGAMFVLSVIMFMTWIDMQK